MKTPFEIYINFICNALLGSDPNLVDQFYSTYESIIQEAVDMMHKKYPITPETYYRGILLKPDEFKDLTLEPLDHVKYLSFTADKNVALEFADTSSEMSFFVMQNDPDSKGFLIEHKPNLDEILFHYSWVDVLGLNMYFSDASLRVIAQQKEITLKQRMKKFKLTAV